MTLRFALLPAKECKRDLPGLLSICTMRTANPMSTMMGLNFSVIFRTPEKMSRYKTTIPNKNCQIRPLGATHFHLPYMSLDISSPRIERSPVKGFP
ncbi:ABC transporter domain-containing protein [Psidium guajava]|nr:ABC transporter domain-containing protein [Psidium guajava]